jgi:hypothetical protein
MLFLFNQTGPHLLLTVGLQTSDTFEQKYISVVPYSAAYIYFVILHHKFSLP